MGEFTDALRRVTPFLWRTRSDSDPSLAGTDLAGGGTDDAEAPTLEVDRVGALLARSPLADLIAAPDPAAAVRDTARLIWPPRPVGQNSRFRPSGAR